MAAQDKPAAAEKVSLVLLVPTQGAERGAKVKTDRETADQLIANQQAREA